MNSKSLVKQALNHRAKQLPIDFGSSAVTGVHVSVVDALRKHYGLPPELVRVIEPYQMLGEVTADLSNAMGIDTVGVPPRLTMFGFPVDGLLREWRCPWGQIVLVPPGFQTMTDSSGEIFIFPEGDITAPVSGHMPAKGFFFDTVIRQDPIDEDALNLADNLEEFTLFSPADEAYWKEKADWMRNEKRAVMANLGGTGFGDISLVPAPFLKHPHGIRDISEWYISLVTRRDYVHAIFSKQCEVSLHNLSRLHAIVGEMVDVLYVCGTDFGTQISQFCSAETFDDLYLPYYKQINEWVHRNTGWKTFKHTCGAIDPLLPNIIRAGFDIINPVQCSALGMDPEHLESKYGKELVFWGGGVDTQHTLPFGTPEQVHAEVLSRCRIFGRNGGFMFNTIHNIQARTPTMNVIAMLDAVHSFNSSGF